MDHTTAKPLIVLLLTLCSCSRQPTASYIKGTNKATLAEVTFYGPHEIEQVAGTHLTADWGPTNWGGGYVVFYMPSNKTTQIGLRSDGVVVWRQANSK